MKVLVACEYSGRVRDAFIQKGHDAWSCDLLPTEQEGNHYQCDVRDILSNGWDLMIAHPPCTYLASSGARWWRNKQQEQLDALMFVLYLSGADIPKIAIENPVGKISTHFRKPDQIIQPYQFGHPTTKTTCLWLKNLPKLIPTHIVEPEFKYHKNGKRSPHWHFDSLHLQKEERRKIRSLTFLGIAQAMAEQWG